MVDTKKLAKVAARLNAESDSINATIQKIQAKVNGCNVGLRVWLEHPPLSVITQDKNERREVYDLHPNASRVAFEMWLGYDRLEGEWQFIVKEWKVYYGSDQWGEEEVIGSYESPHSPLPLLKASREYRIKALTVVQLLIDRLVVEAEASMTAIEKAKTLAEEL